MPRPASRLLCRSAAYALRRAAPSCGGRWRASTCTVGASRTTGRAFAVIPRCLCLVVSLRAPQRVRNATAVLVVCEEVFGARGTAPACGAHCIAGHPIKLARCTAGVTKDKRCWKRAMAQHRAQRCGVPPLHQRQHPKRTLHRVVQLRRRRYDGGRWHAELLRKPLPSRLGRLQGGLSSASRAARAAAQLRTGPPGTSL